MAKRWSEKIRWCDCINVFLLLLDMELRLVRAIGACAVVDQMLFVLDPVHFQFDPSCAFSAAMLPAQKLLLSNSLSDIRKSSALLKP